MRQSLIAAMIALAPAMACAAPTPKADPAVVKAVADSARKPENRLRDRYRHPVETLAFFGVKPGQTVVEFVPGGGWYTEILAPLEASNGRYIALVPDRPQAIEGANRLIEANRTRYGAARVATIKTATGQTDVPDGSADVVLTFRNVHNLIMSGGEAASGTFAAFFRMLKPGGTLGVVDHRLPEGRDGALELKSGYLKRSTIVRLATQAGFKLAGESEINANPRDSADWPEGVWTLPPSYRLMDVDRAKYAAIGESDRMTLRFVKPK